jgi:hypothetical protein
MQSVSSDGIHFGPTPNGKRYVSLYNHRQANRGKSVWLKSVRPADEYQMFSDADNYDWYDTRGNYWSLRDGGAEVGTRGERVAKHPVTTNPTDPWHGYPASPNQKGAGDAPPDPLVEGWLADGLVTRTFARRLQRWRL